MNDEINKEKFKANKEIDEPACIIHNFSLQDAKSRVIQPGAEFFNGGIVNPDSTSLSTGCCNFAQLNTGFEAEKFEHACSMKAIGHRSRKLADNAG